MYKKGKGASAFGRTNWSKRWFELDGTHLSYWEGFSPAADRPLGEPKGRVAVRGARLVEDVAHRQEETGPSRGRGGPLSGELSSEHLLVLGALAALVAYFGARASRVTRRRALLALLAAVLALRRGRRALLRALT